MNQIKLKIKEIGLSQREISVRLGKNPSYLAGVFRSGLSTAKQAKLLNDLEVVGKGGYFQSEGDIIAQLDRSVAKLQAANSELRNESDKYFNETQVLDTELCRVNKENNMLCGDLQKLKRDTANLLDKNRAELSVKQKHLTQTQKYLMEANRECEKLKDKYKFVVNFNCVLCLIILGMVITWVLA